MKKVLVIPLVASSALFGCQDQNQSAAHTAMEAKAQIPAWSGSYQGTTPCMGCLSSCDDCPGMAVTLTLNQDQTFTLLRESLSGQQQLESMTGQIRFQDETQQKIELLNVDSRNLLSLDLKKHVLEIREDQTGQRYQMQNDFILFEAG